MAVRVPEGFESWDAFAAWCDETAAACGVPRLVEDETVFDLWLTPPGLSKRALRDFVG